MKILFLAKTGNKKRKYERKLKVARHYDSCFAHLCAAKYAEIRHCTIFEVLMILQIFNVH